MIQYILVAFVFVFAVWLAGCAGLVAGGEKDPRIPAITTQPTDQAVAAGQAATFSVVGSGSAPLRYQWTRNGRSIRSATEEYYTISAATTSDNGAQFTAEISNSQGIVQSRAVTLTVNGPGQVRASPSNLDFGNVLVGSNSTRAVTLTASGSSNVTISKVGISGPGFNASGIPAGLILTPGQSATVDVTFAPAATGNVTGSVPIACEASGSSTIITLSGSGVHPASYSVALAWASSSPTVVGYNVYRATTSGGPYERVEPWINTTTAFTDTTVQTGQSYYYVLTSVSASNEESKYSSEVSATIPTL